METNAKQRLLADEREELDAAWEKPIWRIAGYELQQMTLRDFLLLHRTNPIVSRASTPKPSDLAQFVSMLSRTTDSPETVIERITASRAEGHAAEHWDMAAKVVSYAWNQAPRKKKKETTGGIPMTSGTAAMVHRFAKTYSMSIPGVLDLPIAQIWQLNREMLIDAHGYDKARSMVITPAESAVYTADLREAARQARETKTP